MLEYKQQVEPLLRGREAVPGRRRAGVYANSETIGWARQDGIGAHYRQPNWGSPGRVAHPAAHLHRVDIDTRQVGGVGVETNRILEPRFRRWDQNLTD